MNQIQSFKSLSFVPQGSLKQTVIGLHLSYIDIAWDIASTSALLVEHDAALRSQQEEKSRCSCTLTGMANVETQAAPLQYTNMR